VNVSTETLEEDVADGESGWECVHDHVRVGVNVGVIVAAELSFNIFLVMENVEDNVDVRDCVRVNVGDLVHVREGDTVSVDVGVKDEVNEFVNVDDGVTVGDKVLLCLCLRVCDCEDVEDVVRV
jgi:hypothetical protein